MTAKIVWQGLRHDRARFFTAVSGVAAAAALLTWAVGFAMTSIAQNRQRVAAMTAPYTCWISPIKAGGATGRQQVRSQLPNRLPDALWKAINELPEVGEAARFTVYSGTLDYRPDGRVLQGPPLRVGLCEVPDSGMLPYNAKLLAGVIPEWSSTVIEGVICRSVFTPRQFQSSVPGETITLIIGTKAVPVKISGVVDIQETIQGFPTLFVSRPALQKIIADNDQAQGADLILCQTKSSTGEAVVEHLVANWEDGRFQGTFVNRAIVQKALTSDRLSNFKKQLPLLLTLSILTAFFVTATSLNMGLEKRARSIALLRCAGMTKAQVKRIVFFEGAIVAFCGWALGLVVATGALYLFAQYSDDLFPEGIALGWVTPVASAAMVALVTLVAMIAPALRTAKIKPLDAIKPCDTGVKTISIARSLLALLLLLPLLALALPWPISAMSISVLIVCVGLPLHICGLYLVIPALMKGVEKVALPLLCRVFRLDRRILQRRILRHYSLHASMAITLAIGLGTYIAIHIWGASLTAPFIPSATLPDLIVDFLPGGIPNSMLEKIAQLDGREKTPCTAIEAAQYQLTPEILARATRQSHKPIAPGFDNILLLGVNPELTFGGVQPLAPFAFIEGSASAATAALQQGANCIITEMFARQTGLKRGDQISFLTSPNPRQRSGEKALPSAAGVHAAQTPSPSDNRVAAKQNHPPTESLTICGIVDLNWHLVTSRGQLRGRHGFSQATMGPVFVSEQLARSLSNNHQTTYYLWMNMGEKYAGVETFKAGVLLEQQIRELCVENNRYTVRVHHRDEIADGTLAHGANIVGDMARAPFYAMIILALGMISMIIGLVEQSAHELAVMRAVGMTRAQLGRMLFIESLMVGLCGIALSLLSGVCIGWSFTGWTRAWMSFGGLPATLTIPWHPLLAGISLFVGLCILMPLWPIYEITKTKRK